MEQWAHYVQREPQHRANLTAVATEMKRILDTAKENGFDVHNKRVLTSIKNGEKFYTSQFEVKRSKTGIGKYTFSAP